MKPFYLIKWSCFLIFAIFLFGCSSTVKGTSAFNSVSSVDSSETSLQNDSVSSIYSSENTSQSLQNQKEDLPVETYGFVYNSETQTNDLILLDCATGNTECVLSIEQNVGTACALSRNRTWLAYAVAKNEDLTSAVYLVVRNLQTGEAKNFFLEADFFQWIESIVFLPDNQTLIVNVTQGQQWENTVLYQLNVQDDTCLLLDSVDFSGSTIETQENLDALVTKYNSNASLPLYVQFSLPAVAPDGKTIYYAATLYRSATPAYQMVGIWNLGSGRRRYATAPPDFFRRRRSRIYWTNLSLSRWNNAGLFQNICRRRSSLGYLPVGFV